MHLQFARRRGARFWFEYRADRFSRPPSFQWLLTFRTRAGIHPLAALIRLIEECYASRARPIVWWTNDEGHYIIQLHVPFLFLFHSNKKAAGMSHNIIGNYIDTHTHIHTFWTNGHQQLLQSISWMLPHLQQPKIGSQQMSRAGLFGNNMLTT